jgi:1,4-alpha-glucan branching enzyme
MGWANDFYDYLMTDPYFRKDKHHALNFPIMYAFSENYVLPISHDEVVHGKLSFINKMYGSYEDKFYQMRAALLLMMTYPGKKLMFMGTEYAQFREWNYADSLEWFMTDYPLHKSMREYVAALNRFYLEHRELWENDFSYLGFEWIFPDEAEKNLVAFKRKSQDSELVAIINFSGVSQSLEIGIKNDVTLKCLFSTDYADNAESELLYDGEKNRVRITIPAFYGRIYKEKSKLNKISL